MGELSSPSEKEVALNEISIEELSSIKDALNHPDWQFRTITGIHKETGIAPERIAGALKNSSIARTLHYHTEEGEAVYASSERKRTVREWAAEIAWVLKQ